MLRQGPRRSSHGERCPASPGWTSRRRGSRSRRGHPRPVRSPGRRAGEGARALATAVRSDHGALARCSGCSSSSDGRGGAIAAMAVVATLAGYSSSVSLRLAIGGLTAVLALLVAQGLYLAADDAGDAVLCGRRGPRSGPHAALAWAVADRGREPFALGRRARGRRGCARISLAARPPPCPPLRGRDGDRRGGLPDRRGSRPRLLGAVHDPLRPQARSRPDRGADRDAGRGTGGRPRLATASAEVLVDDVFPTTIVLTSPPRSPTRYSRSSTRSSTTRSRSTWSC